MDNLLDDFIDFPIDKFAGNVQPFASLDEFEKHIKQSHLDLSELFTCFDALVEEDNAERRLPKRKEREKRIQALYKKRFQSTASGSTSKTIKSRHCDSVSNLPLKISLRTSQESSSNGKFVQKLSAAGGKEHDGPMKRLQYYVEEKLRVEIMLRGQHRVNAVVSGVITAFDKHFDLVVRDAHEIYCPPSRYQYRPCSCGERDVCTHYVHTFYQFEQIFPNVSSKRILLGRYLEVVFIRGDQVVLIKYDPEF